jgi:hypothetical protein
LVSGEYERSASDEWERGDQGVYSVGFATLPLPA